MEVNKQPSSTKSEPSGKDNICRLCASTNANIPIFPNMGPPFSLKSTRGPPLVCKIMSSLNIQLRSGDGLPTNICQDCAAKVESTYEFLRLCEVSDSFLRQYLDFGLQLSWIFRYSELLQMIDHVEEESNDDL
ncbi:uncharacterized protein LOC129005455 [Macrosteles quadrilineatus]|uniref:uncharacterized protein LOC128995298 n=1 Tax=Macrosteles quadrilineatus TaxID=74068 RepID=UPI0023E13DDC|nr:uncharacterized protein LOC128995298 [Macrosteles quadrilineatus]XP_054290318.1 uncharacterized protein LOC129005455 [Macrosteles quadrilineatus]